MGRSGAIEAFRAFRGSDTRVCDGRGSPLLTRVHRRATVTVMQVGQRPRALGGIPVENGATACASIQYAVSCSLSQC